MGALLAAYAAVVIAWYAVGLKFCIETVTDPAEVFLLKINVSIQFGAMTIFFLFGPVQSAFRSTLAVLRQMKLLAQQTAEPDRGEGFASG